MVWILDNLDIEDQNIVTNLEGDVESPQKDKINENGNGGLNNAVKSSLNTESSNLNKSNLDPFNKYFN